MLAAISVATSGCGKSSEASEDDARTAAKAAPTAIVVALQADGSTLDPHKATDAGSKRLLENLYSGLFRYSSAYGEVEPDLAEAYSWSDDSRVLTVTLVDNAVFHSGRTVTADDVKYSLERMRDSGVQSESFQTVTAIETPDERTVIIKLAEPLAPFVTWLADPMNVIVDRQVVAANDGNIDRVDAGCGPYTLVEWKPDLHCKLQAHNDYHVDDRPALKTITYRPIPDDTASMTALRNGEVDLVFDVSAKSQTLFRGVDNVRVESVPGTFWEYIGLNTTVAPLDDVRVRQAIAHAIDREAINKLVKFGTATVLDGGHIPPGHWAHAADLHVYPKPDPERARSLLAAAGVSLPIALELKVGSDFAYQVQAAQIVKQQLKPIGIDVTVTAMESKVFFDQLNNRDFQMTIVGWLGFVDPDEWTYNLFHTDGKFNQQGYSNAEVDALLERGRRTLERAERVAIYRDIQQRIAEDAPMVFLYANPRTAAMRPAVTDFVVHPTVRSIFLRDTALQSK